MSLFTDDISYLENPKDSTKELLELINKKYSKVVRYKINIQKPFVFLYTSNKLSEREIKKAIPFTIASKKILRNKFNQEDLRPVH